MEAKIRFYPCRHEAKPGPVDVIAIIRLLPRHTDQLAVERVVPAVIAADKRFCTPLFGSAKCVSAMAARIEKDVDPAGFVANDDDLILPDRIDEIIAGVGKL